MKISLALIAALIAGNVTAQNATGIPDIPAVPSAPKVVPKKQSSEEATETQETKTTDKEGNNNSPAEEKSELTDQTPTKTETTKKPEPEKVSLHYIKPGGSLTAVSEEAYGRTRYWRILKLYNKVNPSKLQVGQEIKAPEIPWLISKSGLSSRYFTSLS